MHVQAIRMPAFPIQAVRMPVFSMHEVCIQAARMLMAPHIVAAAMMQITLWRRDQALQVPVVVNKGETSKAGELQVEDDHVAEHDDAEILDWSTEVRYAEFGRLIADLSRLNGLELGRLIDQLRKEQEQDHDHDQISRTAASSLAARDKSSSDVSSPPSGMDPTRLNQVFKAAAASVWSKPAPTGGTPVRLPDSSVRYAVGCRKRDH